MRKNGLPNVLLLLGNGIQSNGNLDTCTIRVHSVLVDGSDVKAYEMRGEGRRSAVHF